MAAIRISPSRLRLLSAPVRSSHMIDLQIRIEGCADDERFEPHRLSLRLGNSVLTHLLRRDSDEPDDWLEAPPVPLAFWFIDN